MTRIDAHQHFWRMDRGDYGWLTKQSHPELARDFLPHDLEPMLRALGIDKTILVQAAPSEDETAFLIALAWDRPFIAGVVGWADFEAPDAPDRIARLCAGSRLKGLRPMLQDLADDEWLLRPAHARVFDAMQRGRLCFDALVKPRHLPMLAEFLERHPDLPVVIDHGAKPDFANLDLWATCIRHIGRETNAFCKLSGLVTQFGAHWETPALKPAVDVLLEAFGPGRLMWGSDWPVLTEAGEYGTWFAAAQELVPQEAHDAVFGGTAERFYGLT